MISAVKFNKFNDFHKRLGVYNFLSDYRNRCSEMIILCFEAQRRNSYYFFSQTKSGIFFFILYIEVSPEYVLIINKCRFRKYLLRCERVELNFSFFSFYMIFKLPEKHDYFL